MIFTFLKMALKFIGSFSLLKECNSINLTIRSIDWLTCTDILMKWTLKIKKNISLQQLHSRHIEYVVISIRDIIVALIWKHCSVQQLFSFYNGEVFSLYMGMKIPCWGEIGMGKFPNSSLKAHNIFPIHGLAVIVKRNFPIRGFAAHGEIYFHYSC